MPFLLWVKDGIIRPTDDEHRTTAGPKLIEYLDAELDRREAAGEPRDDLIGGFLTAEVDGHRLTRDDVIDITFLLVLAGLDTVTSSLSCMVDWLARHPAERDRLVADPSMLPGAIEELMRVQTPVVAGSRHATADFEIDDVKVEAGDELARRVGRRRHGPRRVPGADHRRLRPTEQPPHRIRERLPPMSRLPPGAARAARRHGDAPPARPRLPTRPPPATRLPEQRSRPLRRPAAARLHAHLTAPCLVAGRYRVLTRKLTVSAGRVPTMTRFLRTMACLLGVLATFGGAIGPVTNAAAADADPARVVILSAGQAPRSPLRMTFTQGETVVTAMTTTQSLEQTIEGTPTNSVGAVTTTMTMTTTVDSVDANGDATISYGYSNVDVADDGTLSAAEVAAIRAAFAPITSVVGTATVTPENQLSDSEVSGLDGLDPIVSRIMSQVADQGTGLQVPFPRQAVGVGARWRATTTLTLNGIDLRQAYVFTLRARDGDRIELDTEFTQTAPRQRAELPGVPAGTQVQVTRFRTTGNGNATLDLTEPVPLASESEAAGAQVFDVRAQGQQGTLRQKVEIGVELSRA